ncbi:hypothetical protein [Actinomadura sp. GTD37]|uniref:hypothetical protein n=1 Tax=Actinomadura sp. GTD37 TaxID=1778030 RepID=UPI0035BFBF9A
MDVFPELVADIVELLAADGEPLADTIADLPFLGPCTCSPTCANLLTAPLGSSGSLMIQLQRNGEESIWLSLDTTATAVTGIEMLDGRDLGPAARRVRVR